MAQTAPSVSSSNDDQPPLPQTPALKWRSPTPRHLIPLLFLLLGLGALAWYLLHRPNPNALELSGRIEGYESDVGTKVAGRVDEVAVREGDAVAVGDLLVRLDDDELKAQLQGAQARLDAARQQEENARLQVAVLQNQIAEAQLRLQQSQGQTSGQVAQSEAQVAAAIAQLRQAEALVVQAEANLELARADRDRFVRLAAQGAVSRQRAEQAIATFRTTQASLNSQRAAVAAAQRQVAAAQGALTQAQTTALNPAITTTQIARLNTQLAQAQAAQAAAQAEVASARAAVRQAEAAFNNLTITSPIDGIVTTRSVEPGVVVAPGRILVSVINPNLVYLRGFIPAGDIGRVKVGQAARVYLDSDPDRPLNARVASIDAQASFTPENIYFREDRVRQVFGVRLAIAEPGGFAKPGMPASAEILLQQIQPE